MSVDLKGELCCPYCESRIHLSDMELNEYKNFRLNMLNYLRAESDNAAEKADDTFLWVRGSLIHYGTWDKMYNMYWSRLIDGVKNYRIDKDGFKNFACDDQDIMESKGVFIITENTELLKQIDILMKKSEPNS